MRVLVSSRPMSRARIRAMMRGTPKRTPPPSPQRPLIDTDHLGPPRRSLSELVVLLLPQAPQHADTVDRCQTTGRGSPLRLAQDPSTTTPTTATERKPTTTTNVRGNDLPVCTALTRTINLPCPNHTLRSTWLRPRQRPACEAKVHD